MYSFSSCSVPVSCARLFAIAASCCLSAATWAGGADQSSDPSSSVRPVAVAASGSHLLASNGIGKGLYVVNAGTGQSSLVSGKGTSAYGASLSADGSVAAFKAVNPGGEQSAVIANTATGEQTILATAGLTGTPALSASGRVAFTVGNQLRVNNADGSLAFSADLGHHVNLLAISPSGQLIAYNNEGDQIVVVDTRNGKSRVVTDGKASYFGPQFSPDGRRILVSTTTGDVAVAATKGTRVKNLGQGSSPAWIDSKTISLTRHDKIEGVAVLKTDLLAVDLNGKTKNVLASCDGEGSGMAAGAAVAFARQSEIPRGKTAAAAHLQIGVGKGASLAKADIAVALDTIPAEPQAATNALVNGSTTMNMTGVPYIHQNNDSPDWWNGNSSCNVTAALMGMQYYNILPTHPITATWPTPHTSNYGWYIPTTYTFNGHTYNQVSYDPNGSVGRGGFGYITQNGWEDTKGHMRDYIIKHGAGSAVDWSPAFAEAQSEVATNQPFVVLTSITTAGHYPLCIGYVKNQHTLIFNDPYGNKNTGYYPSDNGRDVRYDWPGYNNGYSNLNTVHCFIWCRRPATNVPDIIVDNASANFTASANWSTGTSAADKYGSNYRFRSTAAVSDAAQWNFTINTAGNYEVYAWWSQGVNRSATAPFIGPTGTSIPKNQQSGGGSWQSLGTFNLTTGAKNVKLSCWTTAGYVVMADAIKLVKR